MPPGRFGMWLFLSTEVMLFGALFSTFLVMRYGGEGQWPLHEEVNVKLWIGLVNTAFLVLSSVTAWRAVAAQRHGDRRQASAWLLTTILLGTLFVAVKALEYREKWEWGLYPSIANRQVFDRADLVYLTVLGERLRHQIRAMEQSTAATDGDAMPDHQHLQLLYDLQRGVVQWTASLIRPAGDQGEIDVALRAAACDVLYVPRIAGGLPEHLANEWHTLQTRQEELNETRRQQQEQLERSIDLGESTVEVAQQLAATRQSIQLLDDRVQWRQRAESFPGGVNRAEGLGLPVVIPGGDRWMNAYYLLTGFHLLHVVAGLFALAVVLLVPWKGAAAGALSNVALYWQFVDIVWLLIFALFYV